MSEKIKVGVRGQLVIPKKLRKKYNMDNGVIVEIDDTGEGLLLKPFNPVSKLKGIGKGLYGDPVRYQKKVREEWDSQQ